MSAKKLIAKPKTRKYMVWVRTWNGERSMEYGRKTGAVQAGNWVKGHFSSVHGIEVRAKSALDAIRKVDTHPLNYFNFWDDENEVIGVTEEGSGRYEWRCQCNMDENDRYGDESIYLSPKKEK